MEQNFNEPTLGEVTVGRNIGAGVGRFVWWKCPGCDQLGWAPVIDLIGDPTIGLCEKCQHLGDSNVVRGELCDQLDKVVYIHPTKRFYGNKTFYVFSSIRVREKERKEQEKLQYRMLREQEKQSKKEDMRDSRIRSELGATIIPRSRNTGGYTQVFRADWFDGSGSPTVSRWGYEHHYIVEKRIGRMIPKGVVVHHINGNKRDNRPENLSNPMSKREHSLIIPILKKRILDLENEMRETSEYIDALEMIFRDSEH